MMLKEIALSFFCLLLIAPQARCDQSPFSEQATPTATRPKLGTAKEYFSRACHEGDVEKDWATALEDYNEAVRINPHYGEALGNRGAARFNLGDINGAIADYDAALKIFPTNVALQNLKAQATNALQEQANATARVNAANQIRTQAIMGGDFSDPSTIIMMNAQRRGLVPQGGDPSDPASIIMENARRRGMLNGNGAGN